jgi:hypothetical protein
LAAASIPRHTAAKKAAQQKVLDAIKMGATVEQACHQAGRGLKSYEGWRATDEDFRNAVDAIRGKMQPRPEGVPDFPEFRKKYLKSNTYWHQMQWIDVLEGRDPRDRHPAQVFEKGRRSRVIINTPPEHCATVDTPVLTRDGWKTIGEVTEDDWLFGRDGLAQPVLETWEPGHEVDVFTVRFNTGDEITTDAAHKWIVQDNYGNERLMTTAALLEKPTYSGRTRWRVRGADPIDLPERELPLDPYLFGYWLGDGDKGSSRIAVGDEDTADLLGQLDMAGYEYSVARDSRGRSNVVYVKGIREHLPLGDKTIPADYLMGSAKQRLSLLQGLLDSDGTISEKDGRVKFVQHHRPELCRDIYRLIASLGYQPRMKTVGIVTEVFFKPDSEPVFRLERKASRQRTTGAHRRTDFRTIESVTPAGKGNVKCVTVLTDGNLYLIGDGLVETGNAKSTTITMDYVTWRVVKNPNIRVLIVSKNQKMAVKFLYGIKQRLSHPMYADLIRDFAPQGGYKDTADTWSNDMVYLGGAARDDGEQKDPTVQALGMGGQIYGARADLIICDDCIILSNAHQYEDQIDWLTQEVATRLGAKGTLLVVGTRVAPNDLYSELRKADRYAGGTSPWTYLSQPIVLEAHDDPAKWVTLWPRTDRPCGCPDICDGSDEAGPDGLHPKWDGPHANVLRSEKATRTWALVYMQQQVAEDSVFPPYAVAGATSSRQPGPMYPGMLGHRRDGMEGLYVVAGLDPAMTRATAAVVMGVDRATKMRYVLDIHNEMQMTPKAIRDLIKDWTVKYAVDEWRIEKNAFQLFLTQDEELNEFVRGVGSTIREHYTGRNLLDPNFGVASMAALFGEYKQDEHLIWRQIIKPMIELPSPKLVERCKQLREQLIAWEPDTKNVHDIVMALWFAEIRAREVCYSAARTSYHSAMANPYLSKSRKNSQIVVNLDDMVNAQRESERHLYVV